MVTNVLDIDAAITRLQALLGIPYDRARVMVLEGVVIYSIPVSDPNIAVDVTFSGGELGSYPAPLPSGSTPVTVMLQQLSVANTKYTIYTVTTGKTYHIHGILASFGGGTNGYFRVGAALTGNAFVSTVNNENQVAGQVSGTQSVYIDTKGMLVFGTAVDIQWVDSIGHNVSVTLFGYEI